MADDVATDRFLGILDEHRIGARVRDDLVRHISSQIELFGELVETSEECADFLLALCQLSTATELGAKECGEAVDDDELERRGILDHHSSCNLEKVLAHGIREQY